MKWFEIRKGVYINLEKYDSIKIGYDKTFDIEKNEEVKRWKVTVIPSSNKYAETHVITDPIIIENLKERLDNYEKSNQ